MHNARVRLVACCPRGPLQPVDCVVDLDGNGGPMLGVIGVGLRQDQLAAASSAARTAGTTDRSQSTSRP